MHEIIKAISSMILLLILKVLAKPKTNAGYGKIILREVGCEVFI
jgi:hypothetical protein